MLRTLLQLIASACVAAGLSGCCLFHCGYGWGCGYGYDPGYCGGYAADGYLAGGYGGGYGACVVPPTGPECPTGIGGPLVSPVHRARAVRMQRLRGRGYAAHRGHHPRGYCGAGGYGCPDCYGGDYCGTHDCCPDVCCPDPCGTCGNFSTGGMPVDSGMTMDGGWMPSSGAPCACGDEHSSQFGGGWVEGPWVEQTPQTIPQSPVGAEPKAMPPEQESAAPMTQQMYFMPSGSSAPLQTLPLQAQPVQMQTMQMQPMQTQPVQSHAPADNLETGAGSPIQPVLWVPGGL